MFNVSELEFKEHVSIEVIRKFDAELNAIQKRYILDWLNAEIESHYTHSMPTELFNAYCKMSNKAKTQLWEMFGNQSKALADILENKGIDFFEQLFVNAKYFAERRYCNA